MKRKRRVIKVEERFQSLVNIMIDMNERVSRMLWAHTNAIVKTAGVTNILAKRVKRMENV